MQSRDTQCSSDVWYAFFLFFYSSMGSTALASFHVATADFGEDYEIQETIKELTSPTIDNLKRENNKFLTLIRVFKESLKNHSTLSADEGYPVIENPNRAGFYQDFSEIILESLPKIYELRPQLLMISGTPSSVIASLQEHVRLATPQTRLQLLHEALPYIVTLEGFLFIESVGDLFLEEGDFVHALSAYEYLRFYSPIFIKNTDKQKRVLEKISVIDEKMRTAQWVRKVPLELEGYMIHAEPLKILDRMYVVASNLNHALYLLIFDNTHHLLHKQLIASRYYSWLYSVSGFYPYFLTYDRGLLILETEEFMAVIKPDGHVRHIFSYESQDNISFKYHYYEKILGPKIAQDGIEESLRTHISMSGLSLSPYLFTEPLRSISLALGYLFGWNASYKTMETLAQNPFVFSYLATRLNEGSSYQDPSGMTVYISFLAFFIDIAKYNVPLADQFLRCAMNDSNTQLREEVVLFFSEYNGHPLKNPELRSSILSFLKNNLNDNSILVQTRALSALINLGEKSLAIQDKLKKLLSQENQTYTMRSILLESIGELGPTDDPEILQYIIKYVKGPDSQIGAIGALDASGHLESHIDALATYLRTHPFDAFCVLSHASDYKKALIQELASLYDQESNIDMKINILETLGYFPNSQEILPILCQYWDPSSIRTRRAICYSLILLSHQGGFKVSQIEMLLEKIYDESDAIIINTMKTAILKASSFLTEQDKQDLALFMMKYMSYHPNLPIQDLAHECLAAMGY